MHLLEEIPKSEEEQSSEKEAITMKRKKKLKGHLEFTAPRSPYLPLNDMETKFQKSVKFQAQPGIETHLAAHCPSRALLAGSWSSIPPLQRPALQWEWGAVEGLVFCLFVL